MNTTFAEEGKVYNMYKNIIIHIYNTPLESYEKIPFPEEMTNDGRTCWKTFDNVTWFKPKDFPDSSSVAIQVYAYDKVNDWGFYFRSKNN